MLISIDCEIVMTHFNASCPKLGFTHIGQFSVEHK